jgi:hypothetical protein
MSPHEIGQMPHMRISDSVLLMLSELTDTPLHDPHDMKPAYSNYSAKQLVACSFANRYQLLSTKDLVTLRA